MKNSEDGIPNSIDMQLTLFDQLLKKMDDSYHQFAKYSGLSDTAFWIICAVQDEKETYIQKDLCHMWSYSKQTINSALKKLEENNLIELVLTPKNKKDKRVILTSAGEKIAKEMVIPLMKAEKQAFGNLTKEERKQLLSLIQKYEKLLRIETNRMISNNG